MSALGSRSRKLLTKDILGLYDSCSPNQYHQKLLLQFVLQFLYVFEFLDGISIVRVWMNEGELRVGDDIMYVLIGGDIRPRVVDALQFLVGTLKEECVTETELY